MDMAVNFYPHGGDIFDKKIMLDLSININPMGVPESVRRAYVASADKTELYPDLMNRSLKKALAEYFNMDTGCIAVGNGVSELIMAVFHALKPGKLITPVPEFYGILRAAGAVGCRTEEVNIIQKDLSVLSSKKLVRLLAEGDKGDIVMLTNPNNPTGLMISKEDLSELAGACREKGMILGVDESFIPFTEGQNENSVYGDIGKGSLFVLRSFTKLFAMPGIRLGVMLAAPELISAVEEHLPEWNISAGATAAGIAALKEKAYILRTPGLIAAERDYLKTELEKLGIRVYPSRAPYLFIYSEKELYEPLLNEGILIRSCGETQGAGAGFYRIAVRNRAENAEFIKTLKGISD